MEDDQLIEPKIPNVLDDLGDAVNPQPKQTKYSSDPAKSLGIVGYNTPIGSSKKYDKGMLPNLLSDLGKLDQSLNSFRANKQSGWDQLGNSVIRLTNIIPEAIKGIANAVDIEDYYNTDDEVGNWLSTLMDKWEQSTNAATPIYRKNPGKSFDWGDSGWWYENGSSLVNSIGGFAIGGGVLAKGLSGLSKVAKAEKLLASIMEVNKAEKLIKGGESLLHSIMLNQAEGIIEATDVYHPVYNAELQKGNSKEEARQKAADAAAITVNTNRLNILLNLTSSSYFFRNSKLSRQLLEKENLLKTITKNTLEGAQEGAEEIINYIANQKGRYAGAGQDYDYDAIVKDITSPQALEQGLFGFLGGIGQTIVTEQGVNRLNTTYDPMTGKKISVKKYNEQAYENQQKQLEQLKTYAKAENVKDFTIVFNNLIDNINLIKKINELSSDKDKDNTEEIEKLQSLTLDNQAYNAFQNGTTEQLIELYQELAKGPQKEGMDSSYKEKAQKAVERIKKLEDIYNKTYKFVNNRQVYLNRSRRLDLIDRYDEIGSQIINAENSLNKDIDIKISPNYPHVFSYDINNLDDKTVESTLKEESRPKYKKMIDEIKDLSSYEELNFIKSELNNIVDEINKVDKQYKDITSKDYQEKYKDQLEKAQEQIKKIIEKQSDDLEKKVEQNKKEEAKKQKVEKSLEDQEKLNKKVKLSKDEYNEAVKSINDNYNEGETFIMPEGLPNSGEEVTLLKKESAKDTNSKFDKISVKLTNGQVKTFSYTPIINKTNNDQYSTEGSNVEDQIEWNEEYNKRNIPGEEGRAHTRLLSTTDAGELLNGISREWLEYERTPIDKTGKQVTFEINTKLPADKKNAKWEKALSLINDLENDLSKLSDEDKEFLIDYLPLKVKATDKAFTFLTTKPDTADQNAMDAWFNTEQPLRAQIINHLINNKSLEGLTSTIEFQYPGALMLEKGIPENSILDLKQINDLSDIKLMMVNEYGNLVYPNGDISDFEVDPNWKGSIFLEVKKANGEPFPLKLNIKKISSEKASLIYDIYHELLTNDNIKEVSPLSSLNEELLTRIKSELSEEINMFNKSIKSIGVKQFINSMIYQGSDNDMSRVKKDKDNLVFGDQTVSKDNLTKDTKEDFVQFLTNNKRHHIRFKRKVNESKDALTVENPRYLKYLINNKILNTNAKINDDLFQGFTYIYIDPIVNQSSKINNKTTVENDDTAKLYKIANDLLDGKLEITAEVERLMSKNEDQFNEILGEVADKRNQNEQNNISNTSFDKELAVKIQNKLQQLYPEIKLTITNNPKWETESDNIFNQKEYNNQINYRLKAVDILTSKKAEEIFDKGLKNKWSLNKVLTELQIPKEQKEIINNKLDDKLGYSITTYNYNNENIIQYNKGRQEVSKKEWDNRHIITNNLREEIITSLLADNSFVVEINTAKFSRLERKEFYNSETGEFYIDPDEYETIEENTKYYSNLIVPGGTNYTENEITTPAITPSIKGHAQFSTNNGIGWFRSDDKESKEYKDALLDVTFGKIATIPDNIQKDTKIRRILEIQSDLFQKGRNKENLINNELNIEDINDLKKLGFPNQFNSNQFLQLLNKNNNWVTFFVKSIIQDSAKKRYEKVLFPKGDTASKIEGHQTLEEFKKQKKDRILYLEDLIKSNEKRIINLIGKPHETEETILAKKRISEFKKELIQIKQELSDVESGQTKLNSIAKFYENNITNILKKQNYNPITITDEYGNKWNEIQITPKVLSDILLQKNEADQIIGQANIKAMTVLVDAINQKQDTLPHEYAHHYIAWNRNTPIVQEAIKKWGSEEALVQAIGEQAVKQKGEAWDWWKKFVKWLLGDLNKLSKVDKEQLKNILTDAFLNREDLNINSKISEEKALKSPEKFVSLQDIPNTKENKEEKTVMETKKKENMGKLSREEKRKRLIDQNKKKINKKC